MYHPTDILIYQAMSQTFSLKIGTSLILHLTLSQADLKEPLKN